ncbi:hypothetical protein [Clostridium saccharoperbutylacetonicum]|uniref:hypothetical protein n=1 Tax=Clostridium saccharoperbutylacetonicum TaxID=36745 RepID=UPI0039ED0DCC
MVDRINRAESREKIESELKTNLDYVDNCRRLATILINEAKLAEARVSLIGSKYAIFFIVIITVSI